MDRLDADIPLHKAVRFVNGLAEEEWQGAAALVELLLDAGADPRFVVFFLGVFSYSFCLPCLRFPPSLLHFSSLLPLFLLPSPLVPPVFGILRSS